MQTEDHRPRRTPRHRSDHFDRDGARSFAEGRLKKKSLDGLKMRRPRLEDTKPPGRHWRDWLDD